MATTRNIQMQYFNGTDYDTLYPTTTMNQVSSLNSTISGIQSSLNRKLNISGGTMTGNLVLARDPTSNLMAASKQYVDNMKTTIQDDIFFDKLLEKEFALNFVFDGSSRSPSSGNTNTGLDKELKDVINSSAFFVVKWTMNFNNVSGEPNVHIGFDVANDVVNYTVYNQIDSIAPNSQMIISTFNGMACYLQGNRMSYITNSDVRITANDFKYLKADVYSNDSILNITGTAKITFYGIN